MATITIFLKTRTLLTLKFYVHNNFITNFFSGKWLVVDEKVMLVMGLNKNQLKIITQNLL